MIDSEREVDLRIGTSFTQQILGDSEMIVSNSALSHIQVVGNRKQKVEMHFDLS